MELIFIKYLIVSFFLGLTVGTGLFVGGLFVGGLPARGGVAGIFRREKPIPLEDIPGTEEYYEKARLSPEEGGHENPFENDLIELNRHAY